MAGVNRRTFMKLISLAAAALLVPFGTPRKYGRVVAGKCRARVSVDGVEVTNLCYEADDRSGYALCRVIDGKGQIVFETDERRELKSERLTGDVRIWDVVRWREHWRASNT
jgi:hypothetical protein